MNLLTSQTYVNASDDAPPRMASGDPQCDECGSVGVVVQLWEPFEDGSFTARVCAACLRSALLLIEEDATR